MFKKKDELLELCQGPIPPMACLDYDSTIKFYESAVEQFGEGSIDASTVLDWMIRILLNSLMADSASRIFLSKMDTAQFVLDDLLPLSAVDPTGRTLLTLKGAFVISPVWSNASALQALHDIRALDEGPLPDEDVLGVYIKELNLAVIDSNVHEVQVKRIWGKGTALLDTYSLRDLASVISTDGENWFVVEENGEETFTPVLEPRMAALYKLGLKRYIIEPEV